MTRPLITLTTDFGEIDAYVAIMKGVVLDICPDARLVDVSHHVRPQSVAGAAYVLSTATPFFPPGTIHLVVVDPGVGTGRRAISVRTARTLYVAPDNGVLTFALVGDPPLQAVILNNPQYHLPGVSATFHGRDIFAPAAAHLACGVPLAALGEEIDPADLHRLDTTTVEIEGAGPWHAQVVHVDHFGNAITNLQIEGMKLPEYQIATQVGGSRIVGVHRTFGEVARGEPVMYRGSGGRLEVAVAGGSAAEVLGLKVGDTFLVVKDEKMMGAE